MPSSGGGWIALWLDRMDRHFDDQGFNESAPKTRPSELFQGAREYPNVAMEATGAPSYFDQPYPFRDIHDNLRRLHDAFGPARWFWGTDITRCPARGVNAFRC